MAAIYVVMYFNCANEDIPHWCLWTVDDNDNELIFEALGSDGTKFTFNSRSVDMARSASQKKTVNIGRIEADVWDEVPDLLARLPVKKESGWNCQSWVMQAISSLRKAGFLEEDESGTAYVRSKYQKKKRQY